MRSLLVVATVVVPLQTALLHAWIYFHRRRDASNGWLAITALGVSGIAIALACRGATTTPAEARVWQEIGMCGGAILMVGLLRWVHLVLELQRPLLDRLATVFGAAIGAGALGQIHFGDEIVMRLALDGVDRVPEAVLSPIGTATVIGQIVVACYIGFELARAARAKPEARGPCVAYGIFALAIFHDSAVGVSLLDRAPLLSVGYLVMVVGLSAGIVRSFVRSMEQSERLASDLTVSVEERSEELRRKERELVHGERLAALGTLAAGVAHEINDPLAFVSSNLNRVEESWSDPLERRDVPEILDECHEGLARLRGTVTELLRLARRRESEPVPVDLAELVASVLPLVRSEGRFRARWTELLTAVPAVRGDPGLLAQVALQLLLNALRSVPEGAPGEHRIHVSTACEGGRVCLRVHDSGPPIPADELPHLFDPFAPVAAEDAAPRLGLAITHQIVASHGGGLEVESDERGTEVTVWLPVDSSS